MAEHARLSASGSHRWLLCPGSVRLEEPLPETPSPYAEEGTRAHELAARCLLEGLDADHPALAGWPVEMRGPVQSYLDAVRAEPGARKVEHRVDFSPWVPGGFGTGDCIVLRDGEASLWDYKHGQGVRVEAERNSQLMLYALGAHQDYGHLYDVTAWTLHIVQPRLDHHAHWRVTTAELLTWGEAVRGAAERALQDDAPLVPGAAQCRFCRAKALCRARAERNLATAREEFGRAYPAPETLSVADLAALLSQLDEIEQWAKDVRAYALEQAECGVDLPRWKLVEGRAVRRWTEEAPAVLRAAGLSDDQLYPRELLPLGAAEKLLGGKKKAAPVVEACTTRPPGKPTLAPEDDPRPALQLTSAAVDFADATL